MKNKVELAAPQLQGLAKSLKELQRDNMNDKEDKAIDALITKTLHPDLQPEEVTEEEITPFIQPEEPPLSTEAEEFLKNNKKLKMNTENTMEEDHILVNKALRKGLDTQLQSLKNSAKCRGSRERGLAIIKIQEAIMWLGMDLKALKEEGYGGENPYPESYNPDSKVIEPTADGLKL